MSRLRIIETLSSFVLIAAVAQIGWSVAASSAQAQAGAESTARAVSSTAAMASAAGQNAGIKSGTKISTELVSSVDARKAKVGDQVVARVTKNVKEHGQTVIHKGDRLVGHVTSVQTGATSKAGSNLGVQFDQLVQGNTTTQLNTVLTSVLPGPHGNQDEGSETTNMPPTAAPVIVPAGGGGGGRGGLLGGVGSTVGSAVGSTVGAAGSTLGGVDSTVGAATHSTLGSNSGVSLNTPVRQIHLQSQASADQSTGMDSMLSTRKGDLRLESGTQMQFRVAADSRSPNQ